jgi:hypothetical protein
MADFSTDNLDTMSWQNLVALRNQYNDDQQAQNAIAPYEHQAYAREAVEQNPMNALAYMAMIPGYQAYKVATGEGRSSPSVEELLHGYKGVFQGIQKALNI